MKRQERGLGLGQLVTALVLGLLLGFAANDALGVGPAQAEQLCPLTPEQAKKAATAFAAMNVVLKHPRCINCHGVYGDLHDNPKTLHPKPGGHIPLLGGVVPRDQCIGCHERADASGAGQWRLPPPNMFFTRSDIDVCRAFKATPLFDKSKRELGTGINLLNHLLGDPLVMLAFEGKKGQSDKPAEPPRISHEAFLQLAEAWVSAVYGTSSQQEWTKAFPGEAGSACGCDPNLTQVATGTGLVDVTLVATQSCPGEGKEPRPYEGVTVKIGPHSVKSGPGGIAKLLLPEGNHPVSAVSETDASARLGFVIHGYGTDPVSPRDGAVAVFLRGKTEGLQIGMHVCAAGGAPAEDIVVMLDPIKQPAMVNDKVTITGRVWSSSRKSVEASVRVGGVSLGTDPLAPSMGGGHTDGNGFFSIEALIPDSADVYYAPGVRAEAQKRTLKLEAIPDDKNRYKTGIASFELALVDKGPVEITVKTNKAIYQKGEPVTVSGTVTSEGKGVVARLKFALDPPPIKDSIEALAHLHNPGLTPSFAETTSAPDGSYRHTFYPDRAAGNRATAPGTHTLLVTPLAAGHTRGGILGRKWSHFLIAAESDSCKPGKVVVASGSAQIENEPGNSDVPFGIGTRAATLTDGSLLSQGLRVRTGSRRGSESSSLELLFGLGGTADATVSIGADSNVRIERYCRDANGKVHIQLVQDKVGQVIWNFAGTPKDVEIRVITPVARISNKQTRYSIAVAQDGTTTVTALEGVVRVDDLQGSSGIDLKAVNQIVIRPGEKVAIANVKPFTGDPKTGLGAGGDTIGGPTAQALPSVSAPNPNFEYDVDRPGSDYRNFALPAAAPALCAGQCNQEPQCKAWTYVKPRAEGQAAHCWLKTAVPPAVRATFAISGVRPVGPTAQTPAAGPTVQPAQPPPPQLPQQAGPTIDAGGEKLDGSRTASCACLFAGTWDSTATAPITIRRKGARVEGTYLDGSLSGQLEGRKLKGRWQDTGGAGPFELEISDDQCREFKGTFRQDKGQKQVAWLGRMIQPAACDDATASPAPPGTVAQTPQPAQPPATSAQPPLQGVDQSCFGNDRGAAGIRCEDHYNWAQKNQAQIAGNLKTKVDQLMRCPAMSKEQLDSAFADISVVIPRYVTKKACFGTDPYVTVPEWQPHKDWASKRTREQVLDNLQWKLAAALQCLDSIGRINFFADSSCAIAKAPLGLGGPTAQPPIAAAQPPSSQPPAPSAPQQPVTSSANGCVGFAGVWNSGLMGRMNLKQQGATVSGTYEPGTLRGTVTGRGLVGDYLHPDGRTGQFKIQLSADGNSFTGEATSTGWRDKFDGACAGPPTTASRAAVPSDTTPQTPPPAPPQAKQPAAPAVKPAQPPAAPIGGGQYLGCFKDQGAAAGTEGRDLNGAIRNDGGMTTALCVNECRAKNFAYAGTQYSSYCFCGNSYGKSGQANNCNMKCAGKPGETCGGAWANSVYATGAAPGVGAATPGQPQQPAQPQVAAPTKPTGIEVVAGTYGGNCSKERFGDKIARGNVTPHLAQQCNGRTLCDYAMQHRVIGDPAFGCEKTYVAEWRCGPGAPVQRVQAGPPAGHGEMIRLQCAGASAASPAQPAAPAAKPEPTYAVPPAGTATPPVKPGQPPAPMAGGGQYLGCFKDQGAAAGTEGRDLNGSIRSDGGMTASRCVNECRAKNFAYAGTQYSSYCFCGNSYGKSGPANNCNMKCAGNPGETCGGAWANSVYGTGVAPAAGGHTPTYPVPPTAKPAQQQPQPQAAAPTKPAQPTGIEVVAATYGGNCSKEKFGDKIARGNVTAHLASACNGKKSCDYAVHHGAIGDPAYGCQKNYVAEWRCGGGSPVQKADAPPEAGYGSVVKLQCVSAR